MKRCTLLLGILFPFIVLAQESMVKEEKKIKTENLILTINKALRNRNYRAIKASCSYTYWKKVGKNGEKFLMAMMDSAYLFKITTIEYETKTNIVEAAIIDSNGKVIKKSLLSILEGKKYLVNNIVISTTDPFLYSVSPSYFAPEVLGVRPGLICLEKKLRCMRDSLIASDMNITHEDVAVVGGSFTDQEVVTTVSALNQSTVSQAFLKHKITKDVVYVQDNTLLGTENLGVYIQKPYNLNKTYEIYTYDKMRPTVRIFIK